MASATLLLPEPARLAGKPLPPAAAAALGRADRSRAEPGAKAQLRRHFALRPADAWPVAALTRQLDVGDAGTGSWLRADPAHVAPDLHGARLLAHGAALGMGQDDVDALLPVLKPLFGDAGFLLEAPAPARWYLRLSDGVPYPRFDDADEALGDDLSDHLPEGDAGRRWRALLTEAQVLLHQHPWNRVRVANGRPAINSLWFWGAGALPDAVDTPHRQVKSPDAMLSALALAAGIADADRREERQDVDTLIDLRHLRSPDTFVSDALQPLLAALGTGELERLALDFENGSLYVLHRAQRWRFWRKPQQGLAD